MGAARGRHVAEGLIDAVAGALDLETPLPTADAVGLALQAAGPGLLVLDEAEAVAAAAVELTTRWHQAAPQLEVLITSRVLADREPHVTLSVLDPASGATLFQRRAARVRSTEGLDDEGVARVVAALDGLPLAIELAAARLRVLDLEGLRARLGERFALQRDHTRSLEATLHTSWALLSPDEQRVLVAAAAFPGSFTLEAIEEVAGIDALDPLDVLVRASLVVQDGPRWRLLTVLRAFVRQVSPTDEDPAFVAWTAAWTGKRYRAARGGDHRSLLELIDELPTLKAALERAVQPVAHAHLALACALVAEAHGTRTGVREALEAVELDALPPEGRLDVRLALLEIHFLERQPEVRARAREVLAEARAVGETNSIVRAWLVVVAEGRIRDVRPTGGGTRVMTDLRSRKGPDNPWANGYARLSASKASSESNGSDSCSAIVR